MSDENYRQIVLSFHIIDQLQDSRLNRHIESCRRLIADQDLRIACKGNCNDNALPHTAGELERICLIPLCRVRNSNGSINSMALCFAFDFSMDPLKISASEICFPIFMIGFSADRGSWNTSEIRFPLIL